MMNIHIVGQGLAGSLVAWELLQHGIIPTVHDPYPAVSSSRIAPGVINPLIGKRKLQVSWNAETCLPVARATFADIERASSTQLLRHIPLLRVFASAAASEQWNELKGSEAARWLSTEDVAPGVVDGIHVPFGGVVSHDVSVVDYGVVIDVVRGLLERNGVVVAHRMDAVPDADVVIWCEGWTMTRNPLWNWLAMEPVKGEVLDVVVDGRPGTMIIAGSCVAVPMHHDVYRIGATYDWDDLTETPTEAVREQLQTLCEDLFRTPVTVIGHHAAVRPAARSKRPYVGRHPLHPQHVLFNGLGTKGGLVGPYYARQLVEHLLADTAIDTDVNVRSFWRS